MTNTNSVCFADEVGTTTPVEQRPWKILIVDDEDEIHAITCLVFDNVRFDGRSIEFLSAFSGAESKQLLREHPDIALVLLDVVMEEETSGLEVVRFIRKELGYTFMRIVLRTGQPGQAPEREVTARYDINDYKEKTELTVPKLFTTVLGSLRAYRDLKAIEQNRQGLEKIANASSTLFELQTLDTFSSATLTHLRRLLQHGATTPDNQPSGFIATVTNDTLRILSGIGSFAETGLQSPHAALSDDVYALVNRVRQEKQSIFTEFCYVDDFHSRNGIENILFWQNSISLNDIERDLLKIFSGNIAVAFDNIHLNQSLINTQKEVIFTLGQVIDTRSGESRKHVNRIAAISRALALYYGLSEQAAELLWLASPLHDIGTIGLPDTIITKQSPLSEEEGAIFKTHPHIGYNILKSSTQEILKTAAIIALQHHEHWNGSGYPQGLQGDRIHIFARITKIADTFDLLTHPRLPKEAWSPDQLIRTFQTQRGQQFDPELADIFLARINELLKI